MYGGNACGGCLDLEGVGGRELSLRSKWKNSFSLKIDFRFKDNQEKKTSLPQYSRHYNRHSAIKKSGFFFPEKCIGFGFS